MFFVQIVYNKNMKFFFPKLNQVVLTIIFSEFILTIAAGLITPLFAIFVVDDIKGGAVTVVGFAVAIYWLTKSILQLPVARYLDKNHGEIDDYHSMLLGMAITTAAIFTYYFATKVWHIYALQFMIGVGDSFVVPPFYGIFTRHIDKGKEGFEWSLRSSFSLGAGSTIGGALSGILAGVIGIRAIFLVNGTLFLIGMIILFFLKPYIFSKVPSTGGNILIEQKRL